MTTQKKKSHLKSHIFIIWIIFILHKYENNLTALYKMLESDTWNKDLF